MILLLFPLLLSVLPFSLGAWTDLLGFIPYSQCLARQRATKLPVVVLVLDTATSPASQLIEKVLATPGAGLEAWREKFVFCHATDEILREPEHAGRFSALLPSEHYTPRIHFLDRDAIFRPELDNEWRQYYKSKYYYTDVKQVVHGLEMAHTAIHQAPDHEDL
jgi:hypothetical protein